MTERVFALEANLLLVNVLRSFAVEGFSGAPVVDDHDHVVGFISETDLLGALLRGDHEGLTAADVMSKPPIVVDEFMPTDEVMNVLRDSRIHHLPVVRNGRLVGIITPHDILRYFVARVLPIPPSLA